MAWDVKGPKYAQITRNPTHSVHREKLSVLSLWGQRYCVLYATGAQVARRASHACQELRNGPVKNTTFKSFTIAQDFVVDW